MRMLQTSKRGRSRKTRVSLKDPLLYGSEAPLRVAFLSPSSAFHRIIIIIILIASPFTLSQVHRDTKGDAVVDIFDFSRVCVPDNFRVF